ncbi:MAG: hypothetical protein HY842_07625 [Bacteroidetes bacterium]|nr:hypothetical protein [Bacteroidota bacterium]
MKKHTEPLCCEQFYHIYNRGINGENIFLEQKNYQFFLEKYIKYIEPVAETYAYCLLKNHFHVMIRTRSAEEIIKVARPKGGGSTNVGEAARKNVGEVLNLPDVDSEILASHLLSLRFGTFFNSYAQAINKVYHRTGNLFEETFRSIPINSENFGCWLVYYIHANPQKHRFVEDFRDYPHSSWHSFLSKANTRLKRAEVLDWFGGLKGFLHFHNDKNLFDESSIFGIELD